MFHVNAFKRLSMPLVAPAVVALALVAGGGVIAKPADAQILKPREFTIEVAFNTISFSQIDDCEAFWSACSTAEVYGELNAQTNAAQPSTGKRTVGLAHFWFEPGEWSGPEAGPKRATAGSLYRFQDAELCLNQYSSSCNRNQHTIRITAHHGEHIWAGLNLKDWDQTSGDDPVCTTGTWVGPFTGSQLSNLNMGPITLTQPFNGDGGCTVTFTLRRV